MRVLERAVSRPLSHENVSRPVRDSRPPQLGSRRGHDALGAAPVGPTTASVMPPRFKSCTNYNKLYPHGVGRLKAVDKTSGEPVTNFKRSTALYLRAMSFNKGLDRDKDGIACEKA